jgi:hypothetical protein
VYVPNPASVRLNYPETPKDELRLLFERFVALVPDRIRLLATLIQRTDSAWRPDLSRNSLTAVENWLVGSVSTRARSAVEKGILAAQTPFDIAIPPQELTDETFSKVTDVGMYFGAALINSVAGVRWALPLGSARFVDYGQPVLEGLPIGVSMNPVRAATVIAHATVLGAYANETLSRLFDSWTTPPSPLPSVRSRQS